MFNKWLNMIKPECKNESSYCNKIQKTVRFKNDSQCHKNNSIDHPVENIKYEWVVIQN